MSNIFAQSPDLVALAFLSVLAVIYSITFSSRHSINFLLSLYIARAGLEMSKNFLQPVFNALPQATLFAFQAGIILLGSFLISWVISALLLHSGRKLNWLWSVFLNFAILGLLIATILSYWSPGAYPISSLLQKLFISREAEAAWFFAPLLMLLFLRMKRKFL